MTPTADIILNGRPLTPAQALTIPCASDAFAAMLQQFGLGEEAPNQRLT
jgi:hypothetical protein